MSQFNKFNKEQIELIKEAFFFFVDPETTHLKAPSEEVPAGLVDSQISFPILMRSLGFCINIDELKKLRRKHDPENRGSFNYNQVISIISEWTTKQPKDHSEHIKQVFDFLEPQEGYITVSSMRTVFCRDGVGEELKPADFKELLMDNGINPAEDTLISFEQFTQLMMPPKPLV
eukprot:gnl/Dysnectes_brevis/1018_a1135_3988.p1 GENE.gnl/Dysnectes_brevis/1018_a1135_3988~~gnl/Dysnectes_brevis/1018_a1135_3988.p1  ORF type:complete len:174 (+),score=55.06 gnl/Dysnectes_brevis/1018_a1135_3988:43-564(+)